MPVCTVQSKHYAPPEHACGCNPPETALLLGDGELLVVQSPCFPGGLALRRGKTWSRGALLLTVETPFIGRLIRLRRHHGRMTASVTWQGSSKSSCKEPKSSDDG